MPASRGYLAVTCQVGYPIASEQPPARLRSARQSLISNPFVRIAEIRRTAERPGTAAVQ